MAITMRRLHEKWKMLAEDEDKAPGEYAEFIAMMRDFPDHYSQSDIKLVQGIIKDERRHRRILEKLRISNKGVI